MLEKARKNLFSLTFLYGDFILIPIAGIREDVVAKSISLGGATLCAVSLQTGSYLAQEYYCRRL